MISATGWNQPNGLNRTRTLNTNRYLVGRYTGKTCDEIVAMQLTHEPELGVGDVSKCLPGWIESFGRWFDVKEEKTLSHAVINAIFHTLLAAKVRADRLARERDILKEQMQ